MDNNSVKVYLLQFGEYLVTDIEHQNFDLLSSGNVANVMKEINNLLGSSELDFAINSTFSEINNEGEIATIQNENTWLLIEIASNKYSLFKNPTGKTETMHKTFKGSLVTLVNTLYSKITKSQNN